MGLPVTSSAAVVTDNAVVVNATPGTVSLELIEGIGPDVFAGKVLIDVANANTPSFELPTRTRASARSSKPHYPRRRCFLMFAALMQALGGPAFNIRVIN